jgi:CheY-like chemotaxis protein
MPDMDGFAVAATIAHDPRLTTVTIMMLTSAGQYGDAERAQGLGVAAYLTKPIKADDLQAVIRRMLGNYASTGTKTGASPVPGPSPRTERVSTRRILLVEDDRINQRVAEGLLSRRGHRVTTVESGLQALEVLAHSQFDVVLMDLNMPELGGIETTQQFRARERESGDRLRIVALTADAMAEDRERCLHAGMDGYLSKPIDAARLYAAIEEPFGDRRSASEQV